MKRRQPQIARATVGGLTVISTLAVLHQPTLALVALTVVLIVGAICWVVDDQDRARNLALLIDVSRGGDRRRPPR